MRHLINKNGILIQNDSNNLSLQKNNKEHKKTFRFFAMARKLYSEEKIKIQI